jgi:hypothetical protein
MSSKNTRKRRLTYNGAGIIFTNGTHILVGYQPMKTHPCISGIGGSKEEIDKNIIKHTALREWLEEIFGYTYNSTMEKMISKLKLISEYQSIITTSDSYTYISLVYTFDNLEEFLRIISKYNVDSPYYNVFPKDLNDLLFKRSIKEEGQEVSILGLLPVIAKHNPNDPYVSSEVLEDIKKLIRK